MNMFKAYNRYESWGYYCPCGCGRFIEAYQLREVEDKKSKEPINYEI